MKMNYDKPFVASDGRKFSTKEECTKYEECEKKTKYFVVYYNTEIIGKQIVYNEVIHVAVYHDEDDNQALMATKAFCNMEIGPEIKLTEINCVNKYTKRYVVRQITKETYINKEYDHKMTSEPCEVHNSIFISTDCKEFDETPKILDWDDPWSWNGRLKL